MGFSRSLFPELLAVTVDSAVNTTNEYDIKADAIVFKAKLGNDSKGPLSNWRNSTISVSKVVRRH